MAEDSSVVERTGQLTIELVNVDEIRSFILLVEEKVKELEALLHTAPALRLAPRSGVKSAE